METLVATNLAKVFRVQDGLTVFVSKEDGDDREAPYAIRYRFEIKGIDVKVSPGYNSEEKRDLQFDNVTVETAQKFVDGIKKQFSL